MVQKFEKSEEESYQFIIMYCIYPLNVYSISVIDQKHIRMLGLFKRFTHLIDFCNTKEI